MNLKEFFAQNPRVAVAFSGGVDSAYLLYEAHKYAKDVKAYYVKTAFQPRFEYEDALEAAKFCSVEMETINVDILQTDDVAINPANRCYFCKRHIFTAIYEAATKDGFTILLDGTNASDDVDDRPGMRALEELKVLSPLRICNLSKDKIRELSRAAGLFTWDKPAYACLATRVPTGIQITNEILEKTEASEEFLVSLGFKDFRIRYMDGKARIQVRESQLPLLLKYRQDIISRLKTDYTAILLDLEVRDE